MVFSFPLPSFSEKLSFFPSGLSLSFFPKRPKKSLPYAYKFLLESHLKGTIVESPTHCFALLVPSLLDPIVLVEKFDVRSWSPKLLIWRQIQSWASVPSTVHFTE